MHRGGMHAGGGEPGGGGSRGSHDGAVKKAAVKRRSKAQDSMKSVAMQRYHARWWRGPGERNRVGLGEGDRKLD